MQRWLSFALIFAFLILPVIHANELDPYLEDSTVAVAHIQLDRIDIPSSMKFLQDQMPGIMPPTADSGQIQLMAGGVLESLHGAGIKDVYVTFSLLEIANGSVAVFIPCSNPKSVSEQLQVLLAMVPKNLGYLIHFQEWGLVIAPDSIWKRITVKPSASRPELTEWIASERNESAGLVFGVRSSLQQSVAAVWPDRLPESFPVRLPVKQLSQDIRSIAIAVDLSPTPQIRIDSNCISPEAASRVSDVVTILSKQYLSGLMPKTRGHQSVLEANSERLKELIAANVIAMRRQSGFAQQLNNLKLIGLAMWNFESKYRGFPPRMTASEEGKPLLSWRVYLLPFMDQQTLYEQFHLDEPWDSAHNRTLIGKMPAVYQSLEDPTLQAGTTCIQMPILEGSLWSGVERKLLTARAITDGPSNTIAFVAAPKEQAVVWTKPDELELHPAQLVESFFGERNEAQVVMMDGAVQSLQRKSVTPKLLRAMLTHQGGELVEWPL